MREARVHKVYMSLYMLSLIQNRNKNHHISLQALSIITKNMPPKSTEKRERSQSPPRDTDKGKSPVAAIKTGPPAAVPAPVVPAWDIQRFSMYGVDENRNSSPYDPKGDEFRFVSTPVLFTKEEEGGGGAFTELGFVPIPLELTILRFPFVFQPS